MLLAAGVTYFLDTIRGAWQLLLMIGAGTGAVYLLRWYWWRVNAWSEISAMAAAFFTSLALNTWKPFTGSEPVVFAKNMVATTAVVTVVWLAVTFLTRPEPAAHLPRHHAAHVGPIGAEAAAQTPEPDAKIVQGVGVVGGVEPPPGFRDLAEQQAQYLERATRGRTVQQIAREVGHVSLRAAGAARA